MEGKITVLGLGPATFDYMTVATWNALQKAKNLYLRTSVHPTVKTLQEEQIIFSSFDALYEEAENFESLYREIVDKLCTFASRGLDITYAVPGSPFVAEKTVSMLRQNTKEKNIPLHILPAMSFLDIIYARLCIDPIEGIMILDATEEKEMARDFSLGKIFTQVYSKPIASNLKLSLMQNLSDSHEIIVAHHLGLQDERLISIELYELDRLDYIDHLTSVYIKPYRYGRI